MTKRSRLSRLHGFTLVELLVVIAILVVLIALLLPALGSTTKTIAPNDVRFLSVITFLWGWAGDDGNRNQLTYGSLWPYIKATGIYVCPDNPTLPNISYTINGLLAGRMGTPFTLVAMGQLQHASQTLVFIEAMVHEDDGDYDYDFDDYQLGSAASVTPNKVRLQTPFLIDPYPTPRISQAPGQYHGDGCTVSFADGHAIYWQSADPITSRLRRTGGATSLPVTNPDFLQLQAWSGGPIPPGTMP